MTAAEKTQQADLGKAMEMLEALTIGGVSLLTPFLRNWRTSWGTQHNEQLLQLPGDDVIPEPRWSSTHAISIDASPYEVWPWIAQIGQDRGGLYSYETLENLVGCNIRNADEVLPEHQTIQPGDVVKLHAEGPTLPVLAVVPNHYLLLGSRPTFAEEFGDIVGVTWLFYLQERPAGKTRLIVRWRSYYADSLRMRLSFGAALAEPLGFTMERKMLLSIRERVEKAVAEPT